MSNSSLHASKTLLRAGAAAALLGLALVVVSPAAAARPESGRATNSVGMAFHSVAVEAEPYDSDATNPLRVASYFVHPVGALLEWTVFRPLHAVGSWLAPDPTKHNPATGCERERPTRNCVR